MAAREKSWTEGGAFHAMTETGPDMAFPGGSIRYRAKS